MRVPRPVDDSSSCSSPLNMATPSAPELTSHLPVPTPYPQPHSCIAEAEVLRTGREIYQTGWYGSLRLMSTDRGEPAHEADIGSARRQELTMLLRRLIGTLSVSNMLPVSFGHHIFWMRSDAWIGHWTMKAHKTPSTRGRPFTKIVPAGSLADEAYVQLKRKIIRCELPPDLLVTESQLVRESGLGKTPVREALGRLVQEGLVRNIPRHGYEVAP